jgi:hypothetical protein
MYNHILVPIEGVTTSKAGEVNRVLQKQLAYDSMM